MASAAFSKALDKKKNAAKLLDKAAKAEAGGDFSTPDIPEGDYLARVKGSCGVTPKKGVPFVEFKWTIVEGEYTGKGYRETFYLENDDAENEEKTWTRLGKTLKILSSRDVVTFEDAEEMEELINEIDTETPHVQIKVRRWQTNKDKEAEAAGGDYTESGLGVYFNKRVEVQAPVDTPAERKQTVSQDDVADSNAFKKDDAVIFDGEEYIVVTSSVRNETCTIKSVDDANNRHKDIAWGELELLQ
jgi:hypothetical protein